MYYIHLNWCLKSKCIQDLWKNNWVCITFTDYNCSKMTFHTLLVWKSTVEWTGWIDLVLSLLNPSHTSSCLDVLFTTFFTSNLPESCAVSWSATTVDKLQAKISSMKLKLVLRHNKMKSTWQGEVGGRLFLEALLILNIHP